MWIMSVHYETWVYLTMGLHESRNIILLEIKEIIRRHCSLYVVFLFLVSCRLVM